METRPSVPGSFVEHYLTSNYNNGTLKHREGGTFGLTIIDIEQGAMEMTDPGLPEYGFVSCIRNDGRNCANFGDGWRTAGCRFVDIQPARKDCEFRLHPVHLRIVCVPDHFVEGHLDEQGLSAGALHGSMGQFRDLPQAAATIDAIWRAMLSPTPATNLFIDGAYMQLVAQMLMAAAHAGSERPLGALGDVRLSRALYFIETHIAQSLTIGMLASFAAMSPSHFSRSFKAATGESVWSHVQRRRLERAREMRTLTDKSLSSSAYECGFADASHLGRAFKARYGASIGSA